MIYLKNVCKSFGNQLIFNNINLKIDKCGLYAFIGPSGCGKSTILNMIAKNENITSGSIKVKGRITSIYQDYQLIFKFNVKDNITLLSKDIDYINVCKELKLTKLLKHYPNELSGGQQQRVGIARAIVFDPDIILCDEPTESLDRENKIIVMEYLKKLSLNKIVIIVSHDLDLVYKYADNIYKIQDCQLFKEELNELNDLKVINHHNFNIPVNKIIKKLYWHKDIIWGLLLCLASILLMFMFVFSAKSFYVEDSKNVLNINKLYINIYDNYKDINVKYIENLERIVPFKEAIINNKNYIANIVPIVNNDNFSFIMPIDNEIVINQNLSDDVEINDTIDLVYESVDGTLEIKPFKVIDIIEEDTSQNNIYYNLDTINNVFIEESEKLEIDYDGYIDQLSPIAQADIDYDIIETIYEENQNMTDYRINHPTYELRNEIRQGMVVFEFISYSVQIIYFLALLVLITIYNFKDNKKRLKNYAIFLSFKAKNKQIKYNHFKYKALSFLIGYILLIIIGIFMIRRFAYYLNDIDYMLIIFGLLMIMVVYFISINSNLKELTNFKINKIMKDE